MKKKERLIDFVGTEKTFNEIKNIIELYNISADAYAKIFVVLNNEIVPEDDKIVYDKSSSSWRKGKNVITDLKILCQLENTCEFIKVFVAYLWNSSMFSAWLLDDKVFCRIEKTMNDMESISSLKTILSKVSSYLSIDKIVC